MKKKYYLMKTNAAIVLSYNPLRVSLYLLMLRVEPWDKGMKNTFFLWILQQKWLRAFPLVNEKP